MATMTGCWADVTWCGADSVPPSSSIFGLLAWGSAECSSGVSVLGCRLTSTGGELEAWAAKIWRGLLRPGREGEQMPIQQIITNLNIAIIRVESIIPVLLPDTRLFSVATAADVCLPFWAIGRTGSWCNPGTRLLPSPPCTALSTVWITRSLFCWASAPNETRVVI